jgi:predicted SAM-dependent methyltransferase
MVLLHVGAGGRYYEGFINSDRRNSWDGKRFKIDEVMLLEEPWPYADKSVDGIVGMHVFQQLAWRDLVKAFKEAHRVLKKGGVLRMGLPMVELQEKSLEWLLGWNNINLLSFDLLKMVLVDRIGFKHIRRRGYRRSRMKEFIKVDNRHDRGTWYIEVIK